MHTFFINTSPKRVDQYGVLFDISYANRALVAIPCELENWFDEKQGYMRCVARMSRMIDCYDNLDNAYNLIIFFDLSLDKHFRFAFQQTEQDANYAWDQYFAMMELVKATEKALKASKDSLKEVKVSVSTGTATFIDEMDVESQYLNANLNYLNAQKALILSYYKMVSMTGVGKLPVM